MVHTGTLKELENGCRVKDGSKYRNSKEIAVALLEMFEVAAENIEVKMKHQMKNSNEDPRPEPNSPIDSNNSETGEWSGQEEIKEAMNHFPGEMDADSIMNDRHVPRPWRSALDESKFDRLGPKNKEYLIKILDRFNDMFSHNKGSWRYMKVDPLDLQFTTDVPIVSRPMQMSHIKDRILTTKVMNLIEHDLVKIIEHKPKFVTNISNYILM